MILVLQQAGHTFSRSLIDPCKSYNSLAHLCNHCVWTLFAGSCAGKNPGTFILLPSCEFVPSAWSNLQRAATGALPTHLLVCDAKDSPSISLGPWHLCGAQVARWDVRLALAKRCLKQHPASENQPRTSVAWPMAKDARTPTTCHRCSCKCPTISATAKRLSLMSLQVA